MALGIEELVAEAHAHVQAVWTREAHESDSLILDLREPPELEIDSRVAGALHIFRGLPEAQVAPETSVGDERLTRLQGSGRIHALCWSGGRSASATHTLKPLGDDAEVVEGSLDAWKK